MRAAGLNQLTIKAGNWKPKTEDSGGAVTHQGDAEDSMRLPVDDLMPAMPDAGDPFAGAADVVPIGTAIHCALDDASLVVASMATPELPSESVALVGLEPL